MTWAFALIFMLSAGLILYHLLGYPALLFILSKVRSAAVERKEFLPFVSIIVPAYNEGGVIREKLESILSSNYPSDCLEVIVPEDGSTDNTAEQVRSLADPRVILDHSAERGGKMAAINRSIKRARGDFYIITDANAILQPETLRSLMSNFADPSVGAVSGHKLMARGNALEASENIYWRYESWIKHQESRIGSTPAAVGELLAIRKAVFVLPDRKIINDDFQLALNTVKQGHRFIYDPDAITVERGTDSMNEEYGRKSRIAAGRWQVTKQVFSLIFAHPWYVLAFLSHKFLRLLVFPLMVLAFLSSLGSVLLGSLGVLAGPGLFSVYTRLSPFLLAAQVLFYLLAGTGAILASFGVKVKPLYFLYYFLNAQIAAMSGLVRFSSGRQTVLWRKVAR